MKRGVKQGGILSTNFYKTYIDPLLNLLRSKRIGFRLGTVYVGGPTVADDLAYLTKFIDELQLMLCEADGYSGQKRYIRYIQLKLKLSPYQMQVTKI